MKKIHRVKQLPIKIFLWLYCIISLYPLLYMLFYSLKNNDEIFYLNPFGIPNPPRFENYVTAVKSFDILLYFKNSVIVTGVSLVLVVAISLFFAYSIARINWKFAKLANTYITTGLFIPLMVIMIPLAILERKIGLSGTYGALILPYAATGLAFSTMVFYSNFRTIPTEIEEAAFMDGASILRTFLQVIIPLVKPAIATVFICNFITFWNEYSMALVLLSNQKMRTLPTGLTSFAGQFVTDWGAMGAAMVISSIPTIILYLFLGESVENALTVGSAVKG